MFSNTPGPDLYRVAELRRYEEMNIAGQRRRHTLLGSTAGPVDGLRNQLGKLLVAAGNRVMVSARFRSDEPERAIA